MELIQKKAYGFFLLTCWIAVIFVAMQGNAAGRIEGMLYPVVAKITITKVEETALGSVVTAEFHKLRDCGFEGIDWYIAPSENDLTAKLVAAYKQNSVNGKDDKFSREININTTPDKIEESVAYANHRCHPFFDTITKIYGK